MSEIKKSRFRECAMRDGTFLAIMWIMTFTTSIFMFKHIDNIYGLIASALTTALTILSPIFVYRLARTYRDKECNGEITFSNAWLYIFIIYLCAIVLSSIAQYIFYAYIDPHLFLSVIPEIERQATAGNIDAKSIEVLTGSFEMLGNMKAKDLVISQFSGHISRDILITSILALIIKKTL